MPYPETTDPVEELVILPDWSKGVTTGFVYKCAPVSTLSGWTQHVRHWARPRHSIQFTRNTTGEANNESITFNRVAQSLKPLQFPLWGHGVTSRIQQTTETLIEAEISVPQEIEIGGRIFIYDPETGGTWRTVTNIEDSRRRLTLQSEPTAPLYPQQSWIFPTTVGTLSIAQSGRILSQTRASIENLIFTEL